MNYSLKPLLFKQADENRYLLFDHLVFKVAVDDFKKSDNYDANPEVNSSSPQRRMHWLIGVMCCYGHILHLISTDLLSLCVLFNGHSGWEMIGLYIICLSNHVYLSCMNPYTEPAAPSRKESHH